MHLVLQLAHVAGPRVALEERSASGGSRRRELLLRGAALEEVPGERRRCPRRVAQRRERDREDAQPVNRSSRKRPASTASRRSTVRRRRRPGRRPRARAGADGRTSRSWRTRSSFAWMLERLADLVEEERARRRPARRGPRRGAVGAGERAAHVAEELALEEVLGQRGAVLCDEGRRARGPWEWIARAQSSLPVPLSPSISTVTPTARRAR